MSDIIPGTDVDDWLVAVLGIMVAVTTIAALSHKPPLVQIGRAIGWVFRRLVGDPLSAWWAKVYEAQAVPMIRSEVEAVVAPVREEQVRLAAELRARLEVEAVERAELVALVTSHVDEDRAEFGEITEWRSSVDGVLARIQTQGDESRTRDEAL